MWYPDGDMSRALDPGVDGVVGVTGLIVLVGKEKENEEVADAGGVSFDSEESIRRLLFTSDEEDEDVVRLTGTGVPADELEKRECPAGMCTCNGD
jgi:hypothetical protein